jgi:lipoprotein-anchoring transpeptidase ErfK/SrfK
LPTDFLIVSIAEQTLFHLRQNKLLATYPVSTSMFGVGEKKNSFKTPRGLHCIRAKIGSGAPANAVFVNRRPTAEMYTPALGRQHPKRDWILARVLWLSGLERGINRLGSVDSMQRFIYIHGCPEEQFMQAPLSHGCIRMKPEDIIRIFDDIPVYTRVVIT